MFLVSNGDVGRVMRAIVVLDAADLPDAIERFVLAACCDREEVVVNPIGEMVSNLLDPVGSPC